MTGYMLTIEKLIEVRNMLRKAEKERGSNYIFVRADSPFFKRLERLKRRKSITSYNKAHDK